MHHSIETALIKVSNDLLLAIDYRAYAIFVPLDFNSAFDTIGHDILLPTYQNQRAQEINTHRPIPPMDIRTTATTATTNHGSDIVQPCQHYNRGERQERERETCKQHTMSVPLPIDGHKG